MNLSNVVGVLALLLAALIGSNLFIWFIVTELRPEVDKKVDKKSGPIQRVLRNGDHIIIKWYVPDGASQPKDRGLNLTAVSETGFIIRPLSLHEARMASARFLSNGDHQLKSVLEESSYIIDSTSKVTTEFYIDTQDSCYISIYHGDATIQNFYSRLRLGLTVILATTALFYIIIEVF